MFLKWSFFFRALILILTVAPVWKTSVAFASPGWASGLLPEATVEEEPSILENELKQHPRMLNLTSLENTDFETDTEAHLKTIPYLKADRSSPIKIALPLFDRAMRAHVKIITYRRPLDFDSEFTLLVIDGKIKRAFIVSTSMPGKAPILGIHPVSALALDQTKRKPWPWKTSTAYSNSAMYWAINISDGYFIHSTPHYGNLGRPASMGCIRESLPDAMEVFDAVANQFAKNPSYSLIYNELKLGSGTEAENVLLKTLADSDWTVNQLKLALVESKAEIAMVSKGDLEFAPGIPADAHVRPLGDMPQVEASFPNCGGSDCWSLYHKKPAIVKLRSKIAFKNPPLLEFKLTAPVSFTLLNPLNVNELLGKSLLKLRASDLYDITLDLTSDSGLNPLLVQVCDTFAHQCSKARGPELNSSGEFVYPMNKIDNLLRSTSHLILKVQSGSGTLTTMTVRYYE